MYGLPSNAPFNAQYPQFQNNPANFTIPTPIVNTSNNKNYGFSPMGMDVNGNYINNQQNPMSNVPLSNQGYQQGFNYPNQSVNYSHNEPQGITSIGNNPNMPPYVQQQQQQQQQKQQQQQQQHQQQQQQQHQQQQQQQQNQYPNTFAQKHPVDENYPRFF